ncbi:hypothetical protein EW145_g7985, partial [Phellinidium pouzarii]
MLVPSTSQGLHSSTFVQPPLDSSLSFPALFDWQAEHSSNHPLFVFEDAPGLERTILWAEAVQGIHRATQFVRKAVGKSIESSIIEGKPPVIAVLATSDTISFFSFVIGVIRMGWTVFPISPRNSPLAVAALLSQTKATHLFVSIESIIQTLADAALKQADTGSCLKTYRMPVFEDLFPTEGYDPSFEPVPLVEVDEAACPIILHSSGTTAFPKPIYFTYKTLVRNASFPCFGEIDYAGNVFACHAIPMFHSMSMLLITFPVSTGLLVATFKPHSPAVVPNTVNAFESAMVARCDYIFVSPAFAESWSRDSGYVDALAKTKGLIYGGGPLSKAVGDYLVSNGVNVQMIYALTQAVTVNVFPKVPLGMDWEYFRLSPIREAHFKLYGNNEYELVILATEHFRPNVINAVVNGQEAFATGDIVSPHPTKEGYWKVIGRTDDQIMHSTGEKTNPGPLEAMLNQDAIVQGAMMFGRSRFHCGILVQPKEPFAFDPVDTKKVIEFRNLIWPTIEKMNAYAPTYSRIFK